jgi:hypothetical protein
MYNNIDGYDNTATGYSSLYNNTSGFGNTSIGISSLYNNTSGPANTATGNRALFANTTGGENSAFGYGSLDHNTTGVANTAVGTRALMLNTSGFANTAIGHEAGPLSQDEFVYATAIGAKSSYRCSDCLILGAIADTNTATASTRVGIGTTSPAASAALEVKSTTKGLLIPRMTQTQREAIASPAQGLLVYETDNNKGIWHYDGSSWVNSSSSGGGGGSTSGWSLTGNSGLSASSNFIGTTDNTALVFKMNNKPSGIIDSVSANTSFGYQSLGNNTGIQNTAIGRDALKYNTGSENTAVGYGALTYNAAGNSNTAMGKASLYTNTTGSQNTAVGYYSLYSNSTGSYNAAFGYNALYTNTADKNIAFGTKALWLNTTGSENTAVGYGALMKNTTASNNTALGSNGLINNTTGASNTAVGQNSMFSNTTGNNNVSIGGYTLYVSTTGVGNSIVGFAALRFNTTGSFNSGAGRYALFNNTTGNSNTAVGDSALLYNTSGFNNTAIGQNAGPASADSTLSNATAIGAGARVNASNKVRIGNASVTVIEGQAAWSQASDGRYKKNVKEDAPGLNLIMKLRPVTYNFEYGKFSGHLNENGANKSLLAQRESKKEMGFVAQEVEKALKDIGTDVSNLVNVPQSTDGHYSLAYSELVVPLVRAVQEQQKLIQDQQKANEQQQKTIDDLKMMVEALQKQSASNALTGTQTSGGAAAMETQASGVLLGQNIPNPFDGKTIIPFRIPAEFQEASIVISNLTTGQVLKAYMVTSRDTQLSVDMSSAAAGTYAYTLYVNGKAAATKKLVVGR